MLKEDARLVYAYVKAIMLKDEEAVSYVPEMKFIEMEEETQLGLGQKIVIKRRILLTTATIFCLASISMCPR